MDDDTDISGEKWDVYSLAVVLSFLCAQRKPSRWLDEGFKEDFEPEIRPDSYQRE